MRGRPKGSLTIGADLQYTSDHGEYNIATVLPLPAGVTTPPASHYRVTRLKLFADKELRKNAGVRVDYAFERWNIDEWTWKYFAYADGTTVFQDPTQTVHFIGLSGYYRWW